MSSPLPEPTHVFRAAPIARWRIQHESHEERQAVEISSYTDARYGQTVQISQKGKDVYLTGAMIEEALDAMRAAAEWRDE